MSNYNCTSRTNYFRVKDLAAFTAFAAKFNLRLVESDEGETKGMVALFDGGDSDSGSLPTRDPQTDDDIDFPALIAEHLAEGSVAVLMEAGAENEKYVSGYAVAVNSTGRTVTVSLDDIYELAASKLGGEITKAEY